MIYWYHIIILTLRVMPTEGNIDNQSVTSIIHKSRFKLIGRRIIETDIWSLTVNEVAKENGYKTKRLDRPLGFHKPPNPCLAERVITKKEGSGILLYFSLPFLMVLSFCQYDYNFLSSSFIYILFLILYFSIFSHSLYFLPCFIFYVFHFLYKSCLSCF